MLFILNKFILKVFLIMFLFHMLNMDFMVELFCLGKSGIAKCINSIEQVKYFVVEKS